MIINKYQSSEKLNEQTIESYDHEVLEYLVEQYGEDIVFGTLNEAHTYYGAGGRFDRTGGSRVHGISGALQSLPSLALTTLICWPVVLLAGLGALSYRFQKNYEDKNSWMNRLNPRFWVDYLANPREKSSSSSSNKDKDGGWTQRVKNFLFGAGGAAAGVVAGKKLAKDSSTDEDPDYTKEDVMNAAFVPYWITLSNGEILRVRADSEEHAMQMANMIIGYTTKPCYNVLNQKIDAGCPRYKFYFTDGEMCYWSAPTQKQAYNEALDTRKDLCDTMNKMMPGVIALDSLDEPKVDGKVEVVRGEHIELPQKDKFLNVTTVQPKREETVVKELPKPTYKYGSLENYRANYANFTLNVPAYKDGEAKDIVREFNSRNEIIENIYAMMDKKFDLYRVVMKDGDIYFIPGTGVNNVSNIAIALYNKKVEAIKAVLQDSAAEEYEDFLTDYASMLEKVRDVKPANESYTIKKGDEAGLVKIVDKDEKVKYPNFKL